MALAFLTLLAASLSRAAASGPEEGAGAAPRASTAAAAGRAVSVENPWALSYDFDHRGQSYGVDYRIRWDLSDLFKSPRTLRDNLARPSSTAESVVYGLLSNARVRFYNVRLRPFRAQRPAPACAPQEGGGESSSATAAGAAPPPRPRPRLTWDPLEDLRRNARRDAERFLLRESFNLALPGERGAPAWQKEAAVRGVLELGRTVKEDETPFTLPLPPGPAP